MIRTFGPPLGSIFGPSWVPKREPKRTPRRPKIDPKIVLKNDRVLDRLKTVLGRSWADLGAILGSKKLKFYWFLHYFVEIDVFEKKSTQDTSWVDFGSIWVAEGVVLGGLGMLSCG